MKEYLVPRSVKSRMEFFPGMGLPELGALAAGAVLGYLLQLIMSILPLSVKLQLFLRFFFFALPPGIAFMLTKKTVSGTSAWQQLRDWRKFEKSRKIYYYKRKGLV
ncbi:MAG: hypothetical protein JG764_962 [Clostridiales bacterium]|nr:hypothetical protein [Clostridiales bacterium]